MPEKKKQKLTIVRKYKVPPGTKVSKKPKEKKTEKPKPKPKAKPKPKLPEGVDAMGNPLPTHTLVGKDFPLSVKLVSLKDYRHGIRESVPRSGWYSGDAGSLTKHQKSLTRGNDGSFVLLDTKTGNFYDSSEDYKKGKISGAKKGRNRLKLEGYSIEFVKTRGSRYDYDYEGR